MESSEKEAMEAAASSSPPSLELLLSLTLTELMQSWLLICFRRLSRSSGQLVASTAPKKEDTDRERVRGAPPRCWRCCFPHRTQRAPNRRTNPSSAHLQSMSPAAKYPPRASLSPSLPFVSWPRLVNATPSGECQLPTQMSHNTDGSAYILWKKHYSSSMVLCFLSSTGGGLGELSQRACG